METATTELLAIIGNFLKHCSSDEDKGEAERLSKSKKRDGMMRMFRSATNGCIYSFVKKTFNSVQFMKGGLGHM